MSCRSKMGLLKHEFMKTRINVFMNAPLMEFCDLCFCHNSFGLNLGWLFFFFFWTTLNRPDIVKSDPCVLQDQRPCGSYSQALFTPRYANVTGPGCIPRDILYIISGKLPGPKHINYGGIAVEGPTLDY